jgi:hypothetical protein
MEDRVNQAHLFRLRPNDITLRKDCKKGIRLFGGRQYLIFWVEVNVLQCQLVYKEGFFR